MARIKDFVGLVKLPNTCVVYLEAINRVIGRFTKPVDAKIVDCKVYAPLADYVNAYFGEDIIENITWSNEHEILIGTNVTKVSGKYLKSLEYLLDAEIEEVHSTRLYREGRGGWDALGITLILHGWES